MLADEPGLENEPPPAIAFESLSTQKPSARLPDHPIARPPDAPIPRFPDPPISRSPDLPLDETWKRLVESVRATRKALLTATLEQAVPQEISPALVALALPRAQMRAGIFDDRDNRAILEGAFEQVLGRRPQISLRELIETPEAAAQKSLAEQKRELRARAANARLALGREHPNVRAALELLGGEIEDVKDLGEE